MFYETSFSCPASCPVCSAGEMYSSTVQCEVECRAPLTDDRGSKETLEDHTRISVECVHGVHLRHRHNSPEGVLVDPPDVEAHSAHQQCTGCE